MRACVRACVSACVCACVRVCVCVRCTTSHVLYVTPETIHRTLHPTPLQPAPIPLHPFILGATSTSPVLSHRDKRLVILRTKCQLASVGSQPEGRREPLLMLLPARPQHGGDKQPLSRGPVMWPLPMIHYVTVRAQKVVTATARCTCGTETGTAPREAGVVPQHKLPFPLIHNYEYAAFSLIHNYEYAAFSPHT